MLGAHYGEDMTTRVLRCDEPTVPDLLARGWHVTEESWGAGLVLDAARVGDLRRLGHVGLPLDLVELGAHDVGAILALDAATVGDYPGGPATRHAALDRARATPGGRRRFFGVRTGRVGSAPTVCGPRASWWR